MRLVALDDGAAIQQQALAGGIESASFLGSSSTDVRSLLGRPLAAGDTLGVAAESRAIFHAGAAILGVAFLVTAVCGLLVKALGWELPNELAPIAWALILGGIWMVVAEQLAARRAEKLGERSAIS